MAQEKFVRDKAIYTQQLEALRKRIGDKHISRSQPFYELTVKSRKVCFVVVCSFGCKVENLLLWHSRTSKQ